MSQPAKALAVSRAGRHDYPDAVELLFLEATLLYEQGALAGAEERLLHLLGMPPDRALTAGDTGRQGYKARQLLAQVYRGQRRFSEAEAQWRSIIEQQPRFVPAWRELSELYLTQGRLPELEELAGALAQVNKLEASHLRARAHEARNMLATARPGLDRKAESPT